MATDLHELALQAEKNLEQLATGLAQAKADPGTVQTVTKMAEVARKIVSALGPAQQPAADTEDQNEPPETPGEKPDAEDQGEKPEPSPQTIEAAAYALHHHMQASRRP